MWWVTCIKKRGFASAVYCKIQMWKQDLLILPLMHCGKGVAGADVLVVSVSTGIPERGWAALLDCNVVYMYYCTEQQVLSGL